MNGWVLLQGTEGWDPAVSEARAFVEAQQK
jgi:hypothetical protein